MASASVAMGKTGAEIDRPLNLGRCPAARKMQKPLPSELKAFSRAFASLSGGRTVEREGGLGKSAAALWNRGWGQLG